MKINQINSNELAVYWTEIAKEASDIIKNGGSQKRLNEIFDEIQKIRKILSENDVKE